MATISSGIMFDSNAFNLKEIPLTAIRPEINGLLVSNEQAVCAFQTIRDQVMVVAKPQIYQLVVLPLYQLVKLQLININPMSQALIVIIVTLRLWL